MKSKLLPIIIFLLILLNGVLIFMLVKKPQDRFNQNSKRNFLTQELQFSEDQTMQFNEFERVHRDAMMEIEEQVRAQKDVLFSSFQKEDINLDSLTTKIGLLQGKKDSEVFRFFKKVRGLCTLEQSKNFDEIIKKALRGGQGGPGGEGRPPIEGDMPPPPPEGGHHPPM
ncbi:hypothetical protein [Polaribacter sp. SA4-12]|uniref:hypothetical protein n=1 Tax=Polaribacter sp. SA4-12 TaxID=1312072 RepID=UPI000B3C1D1A|nr:hypothetical protein [Polaribacter sp. SA4-12]ARV14004.1 hypothetical protein BTO07_02065 [Polaribacter sp. SA4-12]